MFHVSGGGSKIQKIQKSLAPLNCSIASSLHSDTHGMSCDQSGLETKGIILVIGGRMGD
jgi:hypothetical protein